MKLKGAQMVIAALEQERVDTIFGYPGGSTLLLYDALFDSKIRHILTRHEQAAVHAADGYARASGRTGVVFATSGPGATNLVTGIANAYMDSIPLLLITGQVSTRLIGTDSFQEADITGITLPITKHSYLVKDVAELPSVLAEAFYLASAGRPGPVLVDIPKDILDSQGEFHYKPPREIVGYKPTYEGHGGQVARTAKAIKEARRPLIFAGGGVIRSAASAELRELAERGRIPVTLSLMGLGAFPGDSDLFLGMPGMHGRVEANYALCEADLIIAVGVRFDDRVTGKLDSFARRAKIAHIDIDPAEIGKNVAVDIPIVGDLRRVLQALLKRLEPGDTAAWLCRIAGWRAEHSADGLFATGDQSSKLKPQQVIREISRLTSGKVLVTTDVGQHQMWTAQHYSFLKPRTLISSGGLGTMGFGFPAAIGVALAHPEETVLCITGDGSLQMNIQELATTVYHRLPVKLMLINNGYLGMVRQWQELFCDRRYAHTALSGNPDFVRVAQAYGMTALRVTRQEEVAPAIEEALRIEGPLLIDFHVEPEESVFPMVAPNKPLSEINKGGYICQLALSPDLPMPPAVDLKVNRGKMKHILSVLVENKSGVLTRVAGLFSRRGFNIENIAVGETVDPGISRMTLTIEGDESVVEQVEKQLNKLINVIKVNNLSHEPLVSRELVLIKVKSESQARTDIQQIVETFRGKVVDVSLDSMIIEVTGNDEKLEAIKLLLQQFGIREIARTGRVALPRGSKTAREGNGGR